MKRSVGLILGLVSGGFGILTGIILFLLGNRFEVTVDTLFFGDWSVSTIGMLVLIFSVVIFFGALLARSKRGISAILLTAGGVVGFLIVGVVFVIPMILALISAAVIFMQGSYPGHEQ